MSKENTDTTVHIEQGEFAGATASFANSGLIVEINGGLNKETTVHWHEIETIRVVKILSSSGTSGTMEYGMTNPTFILPTTFILNVISYFQKRKDLVTFEVQLSGDRTFTASCQRKLFSQIEKRVKRGS